MPKKFAVMTSKGVFYLTKVVREKVKLAVPMLTAAFIVMGAGFALSESELVALAASPPINVTVSAGNVNDGRLYSDNWRLNSSNNWEYYDKGNKVTNAWIQDHSHWYLVDENGTMRVGLYQSYGKYYLLDDVRGTGTYGKLLKNGGTYKGVTITADTSADYEGALSEDTLNRLAGVGVNRNNSTNVTGTAHNTNNGANAQVDAPKAPANQSKDIYDISQYTSGGQFPVRLITNREGGNIVADIYEGGKYYAIGTNGQKYKKSMNSATARFFLYADDILGSDWAGYVDSKRVAPDGGYYERGTYDGNNVIWWTSSYESSLGFNSSIPYFYRSSGYPVPDNLKNY
jgi:pneumococcal surface protein A